MNELCRNADRLIEELHKTEPAKGSDLSTHIERLKVLCALESDVGDLLHCTVQCWQWRI